MAGWLKVHIGANLPDDIRFATDFSLDRSAFFGQGCSDSCKSFGLGLQFVSNSDPNRNNCAVFY